MKLLFLTLETKSTERTKPMQANEKSAEGSTGSPTLPVLHRRVRDTSSKGKGGKVYVDMRAQHRI